MGNRLLVCPCVCEAEVWLVALLALITSPPPNRFVFSKEVLVGALELTEADSVIISRPCVPEAPICTQGLIKQFILRAPVNRKNLVLLVVVSSSELRDESLDYAGLEH